MNHYIYWRNSLRLHVSRAADAACLELERRGQRFLVDFGTDNAIEKLTDLAEGRKQ